jgi:hypothetical protein
MLLKRRAVLLGIAAFTAARADASPSRDAREFGAVYDDTTDSHQSLQAALDWGAQSATPILLSGPVRISRTLRYSSNLTLTGTDAAAIRTSNMVGQNGILDAPPGSLRSNGAVAANISIRNIRFIGEGQETDQGPLVRFIATDNITLENCVFRDHHAIMLVFLGVGQARVSRCEFTNWGTTANVGCPALHMAPNKTIRAAHDFLVEGCHLHDGNDGGFSIFATNVVIRGNTVTNVLEGALYGFRDRPRDPYDNAINVVIENNTISGVIPKQVSATGIEIGAAGAVIRANTVSDTVSSGILLLDPTSHVVVTENHVFDTVKRHYREYGQINVLAMANTPDWPQYITISKNRVYSSSPDQLEAPYAIAANVAYGNPPPIPGLTIRDNDLRGGYMDQAISLDRRLIGSDTVVERNLT